MTLWLWQRIRTLFPFCQRIFPCIFRSISYIYIHVLHSNPKQYIMDIHINAQPCLLEHIVNIHNVPVCLWLYVVYAFIIQPVHTRFSLACIRRATLYTPFIHYWIRVHVCICVAKKHASRINFSPHNQSSEHKNKRDNCLMLFGMAQNVHVWCIGAMQSFLKRSHRVFITKLNFFCSVAAAAAVSSSSLIHLLVYPLGLCLSRQQIHYLNIVGSSTAQPFDYFSLVLYSQWDTAWLNCSLFCPSKQFLD